jgi:hypothetical protein
MIPTHTFFTDRAAPCWSCGNTVAQYDVYGTLIEVRCIVCNRNDLFYSAQIPANATACAAIHRKVR